MCFLSPGSELPSSLVQPWTGALSWPGPAGSPAAVLAPSWLVALSFCGRKVRNPF